MRLIGNQPVVESGAHDYLPILAIPGPIPYIAPVFGKSFFPASAGTTPFRKGTGPGMHRRRGDALAAALTLCAAVFAKRAGKGRKDAECSTR